MKEWTVDQNLTEGNQYKNFKNTSKTDRQDMTLDVESVEESQTNAICLNNRKYRDGNISSTRCRVCIDLLYMYSEFFSESED